MSGDPIYARSQREPFNVYHIYGGCVEAINAWGEMERVWTEGMMLGFEAMLDMSGVLIDHGKRGASYPYHGVSLRQYLPLDAPMVELFFIQQEALVLLEQTNSVFFTPLRSMVAQAYLAQGRIIKKYGGAGLFGAIAFSSHH